MDELHACYRTPAMSRCYLTVILAPGFLRPMLALDRTGTVLEPPRNRTATALEPPGFPGGIRETERRDARPVFRMEVMPHDEQP